MTTDATPADEAHELLTKRLSAIFGTSFGLTPGRDLTSYWNGKAFIAVFIDGHMLPPDVWEDLSTGNPPLPMASWAEVLRDLPEIEEQRARADRIVEYISTHELPESDSEPALATWLSEALPDLLDQEMALQDIELERCLRIRAERQNAALLRAVRAALQQLDQPFSSEGAFTDRLGAARDLLRAALPMCQFCGREITPEHDTDVALAICPAQEGGLVCEPHDPPG